MSRTTPPSEFERLLQSASDRQRYLATVVPVPPKTNRNIIVEHPRFAAILAMVAIAIAFSQRSSAIAVWVCMILAAVIGCRWIVEKGREKEWKSHKAYILALIFGASCMVLSLWLTGELTLRAEPNAAESSTFFSAVNVSLHGTNRSAYLFVGILTKNTGEVDATPVNLALNLTLTNLQTYPAHIRAIGIEIQTKNGGWANTLLIAPDTYSIYFVGGGRQHAQLIKFDALDAMLNSTTLQPHQSISGWVFVQYPKGYDAVGFGDSYRMLVDDDAGNKFTSSELTAKNSSTQGIGGAAFSVVPGYHDLSAATFEYLQ